MNANIWCEQKWYAMQVNFRRPFVRLKFKYECIRTLCLTPTSSNWCTGTVDVRRIVHRPIHSTSQRIRTHMQPKRLYLHIITDARDQCTTAQSNRLSISYLLQNAEARKTYSSEFVAEICLPLNFAIMYFLTADDNDSASSRVHTLPYFYIVHCVTLAVINDKMVIFVLVSSSL